MFRIKCFELCIAFVWCWKSGCQNARAELHAFCLLVSEAPNRVPTTDIPIRKMIAENGCGSMRGLSIEDQEGKWWNAAAGGYHTAVALPEDRQHSQLCCTDSERC